MKNINLEVEDDSFQEVEDIQVYVGLVFFSFLVNVCVGDGIQGYVYVR